MTSEKISEDTSPLPEANDITMTHAEIVSCDGFDAFFGHPKIYLNLPLNTEVKCPYCSRPFLRTEAV